MMKKKLTSMMTLVVLCITLVIGSSSFASTFSQFTITQAIPWGTSGILTAETGQGYVIVNHGTSSTAPIEWVLFNHDTNTVAASGFVPPNVNYVLPFDVSSNMVNLSLSAYCGSQSNPQPSCSALVELHVN